MYNARSGGIHISGIPTKMERLSVRRKRRQRRIGSVGIVAAGLAEPRRRRILLPVRGAAAVGRECGRNVGPRVYTVGVRDVKTEIPDSKESAKMPDERIRVAPNTVAYADRKNHKLVVEFAIPGAPTDTIDVKILEDSVHLTAPARDIEYVSALALGWPVKPDKAEATYEHGLLRIEVPFKDPMEGAVKIAIKAGGAETKTKTIEG
jgi:HSP20 family molecular chaperone IbpA